MKILIAPDKFKGSLSALEVCQAIGEGISNACPAASIDFHPMADGGDGSLEILQNHLSLKSEEVSTLDPLGRPLIATYFRASESAFIEVASASGLVLLKEDERDPLKASTLGTGLMIKDAIEKGCRLIYLFLGGSATNDGGIGIASALGYQFLDKNGKALEPNGANLLQINGIQQTSQAKQSPLEIILLCDVNNPLFGPNGAAHVYAKQKGASNEEINILDQGLENLSQHLFRHTHRKVSELPGSGAAGGIAASLVALFGAKLKSGFNTIAELTGLEQQVQIADIVISGEGKLDTQSLQGKVIDGITALCKKYEKDLYVFAGKNDLPQDHLGSLPVKKVFSIWELAGGLEDAMQNGKEYLMHLATRLGKSLDT